MFEVFPPNFSEINSFKTYFVISGVSFLLKTFSTEIKNKFTVS